MILLDDHLVRDFAAEELPDSLANADDDFATTNLWLFRLASALANEGIGGSVSGPIRALGDDGAARFRHELAERLDVLTVVPMQVMVWSMADLQNRHRTANRPLNAAMAECLAAAHFLGASIAVAVGDVGPNLQAAAEADGITFEVIER